MAYREQTKVMYRIMQKLLEVDSIDEALSTSLETIVESLESEAAAIWLLNEKTGQLQCMFSKGDYIINEIVVENGIGAEGCWMSVEKA